MSGLDVQAARRGDLINDELQLRFLEPQLRNLCLGSVLIGAVAFFLWPHASHRGLIIWVAAVVITLVPSVIIRRANPPFRVFYPTLIGFEILSGLAWGSGTLIAMPRTTIWQSVMLMLLIGVLMSGASNLGYFLGVFFSFHVPLAASVCAGYLLNAGWPSGAFLTIWLVGFVYVAASAFETRQTQAEFVEANLELGEANHLLHAQARTDTLTGLANRFNFTERLEAQIAALAAAQLEGGRPRPVTLGFLDIDRFKQVNDEFGHHVGDELLRQCAERLTAAATESELVARLGGDELTVLSSVDAASLGRRILGCFDEAFVIDGRTLPVEVSVGVATAKADTSGEELMRNADAALYSAKEERGARYVVFGSSHKLRNENRLTLESDVHAALVSGEIVPWLQPIVDLHTGEIIAAEALARWEHSDGVRTAEVFIDTIRQVGLMAEYTEQLVFAVSDFQLSMRNADIKPPPISINVGSTHLHQLVERADLTMPLIVEITEETAIKDVDETRRLLDALRQAGHKVWLDDFGTGYSSMAVAAQLPIDGIKIDRQFVSKMTSTGPARSIVAAMAELADRLSVEVIGEGVEDYRQAAALREFGITMAQGYLWSPAVPFIEFARWLGEGHRFAVRSDEEADVLPSS